MCDVSTQLLHLLKLLGSFLFLFKRIVRNDLNVYSNNFVVGWLFYLLVLEILRSPSSWNLLYIQVHRYVHLQVVIS